MRFVYKQKEFLSGRAVIFRLYNMSGNLLREEQGREIGNLGVYCVNFTLSPFREYILIVYENNEKVDCCYIPRFLRWGTRAYDDVRAPKGEKRRFLHFAFNLDGWNNQ